MREGAYRLSARGRIIIAEVFVMPEVSVSVRMDAGLKNLLSGAFFQPRHGSWNGDYRFFAAVYKQGGVYQGDSIYIL